MEKLISLYEQLIAETSQVLSVAVIGSAVQGKYVI